MDRPLAHLPPRLEHCVCGLSLRERRADADSGNHGCHSKKRYSTLATTSEYDPRTCALPDNQIPGVSILRPLRGLDANLYENLESSFQQAYPLDRFEIIFSVAEPDDQAIRIVNTLIQQYPHVQATLIVGKSQEYL